MTVKTFLGSLRSVSLEDVFNPYSDSCPIHDSPNSSKIRFKALEDILTVASTKKVDSLWIGRDLGYKGGRRTGLALTDDMHVEAHGQRWGLDFSYLANHEKKISERTATIIWNELRRVNERVLLWNVFPFHPHEPDNPFSNRCHNASERKLGEEFLAELVSLVRPKRLIAIGNNAEQSALRIQSDQSVLKARHPSYGGQADFIETIRQIYTD